MSNIKQELDLKGEYIHMYKAEGYKCWVLVFEKKNDMYSVTDHLSTESGKEEDLDYYENKDFNKVIEYTEELL